MVTRLPTPERDHTDAAINPATQNRTRDHLIAAEFYSQMLYQLSYSRLAASHEMLAVARVEVLFCKLCVWVKVVEQL